MTKKEQHPLWIQLGYSKSISAYLIGVFAGVQSYYAMSSVGFYLIGGLVVALVAALIIALKSRTESNTWHDAWQEGITYFVLYVFSLTGTFLIAFILSNFLLPFILK
ncbi:MAG TPA: hypothetical protein VGE59_00135 [Patescibacteria group bacterium]